MRPASRNINCKCHILAKWLYLWHPLLLAQVRIPNWILACGLWFQSLPDCLCLSLFCFPPISNGTLTHTGIRIWGEIFFKREKRNVMCLFILLSFSEIISLKNPTLNSPNQFGGMQSHTPDTTHTSLRLHQNLFWVVLVLRRIGGWQLNVSISMLWSSWG